MTEEASKACDVANTELRRPATTAPPRPPTVTPMLPPTPPTVAALTPPAFSAAIIAKPLEPTDEAARAAAAPGPPRESVTWAASCKAFENFAVDASVCVGGIGGCISGTGDDLRCSA